MLILLALLPIVCALLMLSVFKLTPGKALPAAWVLTVMIAACFWQMPCGMIAGASLAGVLKALDIILIIFGAILLLNVMRASGALNAVNSTFSTISQDRRIQIIVIAWLFSGFIEGTSGFGAAPALAAPLLCGLGFPALSALAVSLICNSLPVPFGAVGIPVMTTEKTLAGKIASLGMTETEFMHALLDKLTAVSGLSGAFIPLIAIIVMTVLSKKGRKLRSIAEIIPFALFSGAAYIVPWRLTALCIGPELPSVMGAVIGIPVVTAAVKYRFLVPEYCWDFPEEEKNTFVPNSSAPQMPVLKAWMPYIVLAVSLLILRLPFLPFKYWLNRVAVCIPDLFAVPGTAVDWKILNNPGLVPFCLIASLFAVIWRVPLKKHLQIYAASGKQIRMAAVAVAASVAMIQIMVISADNPAGLPGMLGCVAQAVADMMGRAFIAGSPFIGIFGTFFSGSCTVSNILFSTLQFDTAQMLKSDEILVLALQNTGGGLGSMIRISGVIAACATVNASGKEGKLILLDCIPAFILALLALAAAALLYL